MPLGQRIAHMAPERRRRIRDLRGELAVGAGDTTPKGEVVAVRCSFGSPSGRGPAYAGSRPTETESRGRRTRAVGDCLPPIAH